MLTRRQPRATVIAFDGLVADTLPARALAVSEAVTAEVGVCSSGEGLSLVQGRSLDEAVEFALRARVQSPAVEFDATVRDLAVLRARRSYSAMVAHGLSLHDGAIAWITARVASHGPVVLRADSVRRDVDQLLAFTELAEVVTFIRCSDDLPRSFAAASTECAWSAIVSRLAAKHVAPDECVAMECSERSAAVARKFLPTVWVLHALT